MDDLIPSLDALFENLKYLKVLADCMTRLISPLPGDTVSTALFKAFSDTNQRPDRAIIQVSESSFSSSPASLADRADLGVRQLFAYAMRHYLQMPRDIKGKELLARHTTNVDRPVLREFADLAERLGFESPEITTLKENPQMRDARNSSETSKPLLITDGAGVKKKRRCGLPSVEEYTKDSESLFINHLHSVDDEQGEGLTSFFVRKSIYSAFFGKPSSLSLEELHPKDDSTEQGSENLAFRCDAKSYASSKCSECLHDGRLTGRATKHGHTIPQDRSGHAQCYSLCLRPRLRGRLGNSCRCALTPNCRYVEIANTPREPQRL